LRGPLGGRKERKGDEESEGTREGKEQKPWEDSGGEGYDDVLYTPVLITPAASQHPQKAKCCCVLNSAESIAVIYGMPLTTLTDTGNVYCITVLMVMMTFCTVC